MILLLVDLENKYDTSYISIDMQLFKEEIFDKAVLIKALLISNDKALYLESGQFADHIAVLIITIDNEDILQLIIIAHFKILIAAYKLAIRLRVHKRLNIGRLNSKVS